MFKFKSWIFFFLLMIIGLTSCAGEDCSGTCDGRFMRSKKTSLFLELVDSETQGLFTKDAEVIWVDLQNKENKGYLIKYAVGLYEGFEGGDIEQAEAVQITVTSPGYLPYTFEYDFPKSECDSDLYAGKEFHIILEKENDSEDDLKEVTDEKDDLN